MHIQKYQVWQPGYWRFAGCKQPVGTPVDNNQFGAAVLPVEPTKNKFTTKCTAKLLDKSIPSIHYMNTGLHQLRKPILVLLSVVGNQEEELLVRDSTTTSSV